MFAFPITFYFSPQIIFVPILASFFFFKLRQVIGMVDFVITLAVAILKRPKWSLIPFESSSFSNWR